MMQSNSYRQFSKVYTGFSSHTKKFTKTTQPTEIQSYKKDPLIHDEETNTNSQSNLLNESFRMLAIWEKACSTAPTALVLNTQDKTKTPTYVEA